MGKQLFLHFKLNLLDLEELWIYAVLQIRRGNRDNLEITRDVFQRKTDVPPPIHSHPYFSVLSAFPPICFIVHIFSLLIYSFKFDLCKHEYLKSFCLIINSACHNYICIKVLLLSTHWLWKNNLFKVKIPKSYYDLENGIKDL